jgi:hypothetical protein
LLFDKLLGLVQADVKAFSTIDKIVLSVSSHEYICVMPIVIPDFMLFAKYIHSDAFRLVPTLQRGNPRA